MTPKPQLPPEQREIVDRFVVDLPKILAATDPFKWRGFIDYETRKCNVEGCDWYQYQLGLCHEHHREQWA